MLKVKSTQRLNRRYLLISAKDKEEIKKIILEYIGVLGYAKAAPMFVKNEYGKVILAITRESLNDVRAAFEMSESEIKIIKVSGTINGLLG